ncbi:MAG: VWA domain-containing protein, partial [Silvibacterium sp.]
FGPASTSTPANIYANQEELEMNPSPEMLANKAQVDVELQSQRAQTTLDNFSAVAKWLNNYPGRKNVFWLSSGFPLQGQPFGILGYTQLNPTGPATPGGQTIPMQEKTDKDLQNARVAIYPIDASGVAPPDIAGETSADTTGNFLTMGKYGDQSINVKKDDQLEAAQQNEMRAIAHATGGVASFNNDIARTLRDDFNRGASYYTISYTPSNAAWNGAYRKINLTLEPDQPGDQLIYRQGYYAKDPQPEPAPTADQFKMAMQHGAPAATAVLFSAKVSKASGAANVEYAIESRTIQYFPDPSGKLVANIDCAILEYDAAGKVIGTSLIRLTSAVSPEQRAALNIGTVRAKQSIALKPKATSLVLGVRDQSTGRFGNLEVALATH